MDSEYKDLKKRFEMLQELYDNQKKIIARLQARNLELEDHIKNLEKLRPYTKENNDEDLAKSTETDIIDESKIYYDEDE